MADLVHAISREYGCSGGEEENVSEILLKLEASEDPDVQNTYAALEEYFNTKKIDPSDSEEYLEKIRKGPFHKIIASAILFKKNFPDNDLLYDAIFGILPEPLDPKEYHVLQKCAGSFSSVRPGPLSSHSKKTIIADLQEGSETIDLEYDISALTKRENAMPSSGINTDVIRRYSNIHTQVYEKSDMPSHAKFTLKVNHSLRGLNKIPFRKTRIDVINDICSRLLTKKAWSKPYAFRGLESKASNKNSSLDLSSGKMKETLLEFWRECLEEMPLDLADVNDILFPPKLFDVCFSVMQKILAGLGLTGIELSLTTASMTDKFVFVLRFELVRLLNASLTARAKVIFQSTHEKRREDILFLLSMKTDEVFHKIKILKTIRPLDLPEKIKKKLI